MKSKSIIIIIIMVLVIGLGMLFYFEKNDNKKPEPIIEDNNIDNTKQIKLNGNNHTIKFEYNQIKAENKEYDYFIKITYDNKPLEQLENKIYREFDEIDEILINEYKTTIESGKLPKINKDTNSILVMNDGTKDYLVIIIRQATSEYKVSEKLYIYDDNGNFIDKIENLPDAMTSYIIEQTNETLITDVFVVDNNYFTYYNEDNDLIYKKGSIVDGQLKSEDLKVYKDSEIIISGAR